MAQVRFRKPCMTNLEPELGYRIINTILTTPAPDNEALDRKADEFLKKFLEMKRNSIIPWSQGGKTEENKCQKLCK